MAPSAALLGDDPRRRGLLEAAIGVFARFGFRKTSMDEVARAAGVSRQGLYLHFAAKEDLFRAAVRLYLATALENATAALADSKRPLEERLAAAFDAWIGRYVGMVAAGASDLVEASHALLGTLLEEHEERFAEAVARALRGGGVAAAYRPAGLTARQLADTLVAAARGFKHGEPSRFQAGVAVAVRALCAPLKAGARSAR